MTSNWPRSGACWPRCADDRSRFRGANLARRRPDRHALRLRWSRRVGAAPTGQGPVQRSDVHLSWPSRSFAEGPVLGSGPRSWAKRLERGKFAWPQAKDNVVSLTPAQLATRDGGLKIGLHIAFFALRARIRRPVFRHAR